MRSEMPPDFACIYTAGRITAELLPLLEAISSEEFRAITIGNPDIDADDENDMENFIRIMDAIIGGFLKSQKQMYLDYGRKLSNLLGSNSNEELDQAVNALVNE